MPFLDTIGRFISAISKGPYRKDQEANLPNGGHTGYHPLPPKKQRQKTDEEEAPAFNGYGAQQQDPSQAQAWGQYAQQSGNAAPQYGQPNQYGQMPQYSQGPQYGQVPPQGQASQFGQAPQQGWDPSMQSPQGGRQGQNQANPAMAGYTGYQPSASNPQVQQPSSPMGQIHYMPNNYVDNEGNAYAHVERLAKPMHISSCFRLIEYMRSGESIIVNMEGVADARECAHCLDILYGAAFSMGYNFTKVSEKSIYLISPPTVNVLPYGSIKQLSDEDLNQRWPGSIPQPSASASPRGFDFERLDREMENFGGQRRYS